MLLVLIAGIIFAIDLHSNNPLTYGAAYVGLSFTCFAIGLFYLIVFILIPKLTNKNKIAYEQILNVDYEQKINQLMKEIGDLEALKAKIAKTNRHYYHEMLSYYENILNRAKNSQISKVEKLADIVTFNDTFTHK
ncbi:MAG: hypothetical protein MJ219_04500 [Mycoplasmoidaceae bacterium]|nr:hypothetical protein [Mycoplasmoidaceae bacterium]